MEKRQRLFKLALRGLAVAALALLGTCCLATGSLIIATLGGANQIEPGMTEAEVRAIAGEPDEVYYTDEVYHTDDRQAVWRYDHFPLPPYYIQFDDHGRVFGIFTKAPERVDRDEPPASKLD